MKKILLNTLLAILIPSTSIFAGVCAEKLANCAPGCPTASITNVDFHITGNDPQEAVILNSITIAGNNFNTFIPMTHFQVSYAHQDHSHYVLKNGTIESYSNQGGTYTSDLNRAFGSSNLNWYHSNDGPGNRDGDYVKFYYDKLITSTGNRYIMVTERKGNNSQWIYAINSLGDQIGPLRKTGNLYRSDDKYISTNHYVATDDGPQMLKAVVWPLTAFRSEGIKIAGFAVEQRPKESRNHTDAGDGKLLLFIKEGSLACNILAVNDNYTTPLGVGDKTPSVLVNDDADGEQAVNANIHNNIAITNYDGLPSGTTISTDGKITIAPGTATGTYRPRYRICLAKDYDYCDTAIVTLRVQNKPKANNDSSNTEQGLSVLIDVLANDTHTDPLEIPTLNILSSTAAVHGITSIDRKGTASVLDDEILYTPNFGYHGADSFSYTIEDSIGQKSTAIVNITIKQAPDTTIGDATIVEGGNLVFRFSLNYGYGADIVYTLGITDNTTEPADYNNSTPLTVTIPAHALYANFTLPTIDDPVDEIDSENFTLRIISTNSDIGDTSDTGTGYILDNDFSPEAQDDYVVTDQGLAVDIYALANDTHPTVWEKITIVDAEHGTNGRTSIDDKGTPEPSDDVIVYTPNPGFVGTDSFEYTDRDIQGNEDTAMVYVTIEKAPDVFIDDDTVVEGIDLGFKVRLSRPYKADIKLDFLATNNTTDNNDHKAETAPMFVIIKNGTLGGTFFLPTIDDPVDEIDSENLTLSIIRASTEIGDITDTAIGYILDNDKSPIAVNDSEKTDQGLPVNVKVLKNDSHPTPGEKIKIVSSTAGTNGTTAIDDKGTVNTEDDEIIYTPNYTFSGVDTFQYTIEDLQGNQDIATVTIKIRQAPSILIADAKIPEGGLLTFFVTVSHPYGADIDLDLGYLNNTTDDLDHVGNEKPLKITIPKGKLLVKFRLRTIDDLLVEEPAENLTLSMTGVTPSFLPISDTAIGYILDNDFSPRAYDDYVPGINGEETLVCVLRNDLDGSSKIDKSTLRIVDNESNVSSLVVAGEGSWNINFESGCITFTPEEDYIGDPTPIDYYVEDKGTNPATATVVINYPPLAVPDELIASVNDIVTINVLENDRETNTSIDTGSVKLIDKNGHEQLEVYIDGKGTFSVNDEGTVSFTPDLNFDGEAVIPYTFKEVNGDVSNKAEISILYPILRDDLLLSKYIGGNKDSFDIINNDSKNIYDISLIGKVTNIKVSSNLVKLQKQTYKVKENNDSKVIDSNNTEIITNLTIASEGTWSLDGSIITFTPNKEFYGDPTPIKYTAKLKGYQINPAKITIIYKKTVPLALDNLGIPVTNFDKLVLNVLDNDDFGGHGAGKKLMFWVKPKHGRVLINTKGTPYNPKDDVLIYKANSVDYVGTDEFLYTITDARGQTSTARVTLNVACSSSQPEDSVGISKYLWLLLPLFIVLGNRRKQISE